MFITDRQKNEIQNAVKSDDFYRNEKVWTCFIASLIEKSTQKNFYLSLFASSTISFPSDIQFWIEAQPLPPRKGYSGFSEGNTKLDLSFGCIEKRDGTDLGIQYKKEPNGWVCFIEAKLFSDSSNDTSYDPLRNQITRVIENLLCFQNEGVFPEKIYFSLLTPKIFRDNPKSKLYGYKYLDYQNSYNLIYDISKSKIEKRNEKNWFYPPNIVDRINVLTYNWVTYEEIIESELNISGLDITSLESIEKFPKIKEMIITHISNI